MKGLLKSEEMTCVSIKERKKHQEDDDEGDKARKKKMRLCTIQPGTGSVHEMSGGFLWQGTAGIEGGEGTFWRRTKGRAEKKNLEGKLSAGEPTLFFKRAVGKAILASGTSLRGIALEEVYPKTSLLGGVVLGRLPLENINKEPRQEATR